MPLLSSGHPLPAIRRQDCRPWQVRHGLLALLLWSVLAPASVLADDGNLGRLFFTPERRQALDRQRLYNIPDSAPAAEEPVLTLNGIVKRSSGKRTTWINGVAQHDDENLVGVRVVPGQARPADTRLQEAGTRPIPLNVGDSLHRGTNEAVGLLPSGSLLRVPPAPPAARPPTTAARPAP